MRLKENLFLKMKTEEGTCQVRQFHEFYPVVEVVRDCLVAMLLLRPQKLPEQLKFSAASGVKYYPDQVMESLDMLVVRHT